MTLLILFNKSTLLSTIADFLSIFFGVEVVFRLVDGLENMWMPGLEVIGVDRLAVMGIYGL